MEIGASGTVYNKEQIITSLLNEIPGEISATGFEYRKLCNELAQLVYRSTGTRFAIRSSIWKLEDGEWRIVFHQGTVVGAGE